LVGGNKMGKKRKIKTKKAVVKDTGIIDKLASGNWIDRLVSGWGTPKEYNKDWYKKK
jgi:hypothetical protein